MDNFKDLSAGKNPSLKEASPNQQADFGASWSQIKTVLSRELSEQSYRTWFEPVRCLSITDALITLSVPDTYFGQWLKTHYDNLIISAAEESIGGRRGVHFVVEEKKAGAFSGPKEAKQSPSSFTSNSQSSQKNGNVPKLNQQYTFDNFVIGPGNRFAHAAALAICDAPAKQYNPLFIYGPVGLGKTHLMQSIAHEITRRQAGYKALYISSEKFTNQLISAIQSRTTQQFRNKYRNLDLLLIDDIHFLAEKEATQEEFFHTFNTLYDAHKQIIVSSDRAPRDIPGLEERLVSRFGWGLVTDIQSPDFETRVAILKKKMEKETVSVQDDVLFFIASKIKSNIRELEGALIRVVAYCQLTGQSLDLRAAQSVLQASFKEEAGKITIENIQKIVADYYRMKISDLKAKRRSRSVAFPRQIAMYLIRSMTEHSFPEIGEYFGGRDHTTVLHAYNKISTQLEKDPGLVKTVEEIQELLKT